MATSLGQEIQKFKGQVITQSLLGHVLKDYKWPNNKVQDLEEKGFLTPIKRGLYITGPALKIASPSPYLLANHIYGPSYVSLEAALSYWGLIPERVHVISSMTTGITKTFRTPAGRFDYIKTRLPYYSFGIRRVEISEHESVLMAAPEKALCDRIITGAGIILRSVHQTFEFLMEDLRIDRPSLRDLDNKVIKDWAPKSPKSTSIRMLAKTLATL